MYIVLWEFESRDGAEEDFEHIYGPAGIWAQFFARDSEYRGTRLLHDVANNRRYVTIDTWTSRAAYESFRHRWQAEYAEIDARCEALTAHEKPLGSFLDVDPAGSS